MANIIDPNLQQWVVQQKKIGYSDEDLRLTAVKAGWSAIDLRAAIPGGDSKIPENEHHITIHRVLVALLPFLLVFATTYLILTNDTGRRPEDGWGFVIILFIYLPVWVALGIPSYFAFRNGWLAGSFVLITLHFLSGFFALTAVQVFLQNSLHQGVGFAIGVFCVVVIVVAWPFGLGYLFYAARFFIRLAKVKRAAKSLVKHQSSSLG